MDNSHLIYLSYFLDAETPLYGGSKGIKIEPLNQISIGDTANTKKITMHNHSGTHIDFPNHFFDDGKMSDNYEASYWIFNNPFIIDLDVNPEMIIDLSHLPLDSIPLETDFLLLKTGFGKYRGLEMYWKNNPGLHPEIADALRSRCKKLRAIGIDFISITSFQNRPLGRVSHKAFLGKNPILLIEDMKLSDLDGKLLNVYCFPLMLKGVDGCPVTIIAKIFKND